MSNRIAYTGAWLLPCLRTGWSFLPSQDKRLLVSRNLPPDRRLVALRSILHLLPSKSFSVYLP